MHQITLTTRDEREVSFSCNVSSDVVSAGEQANIMLPSLCRDGGCGACVGRCVTGEYTLGSYDHSMVSESALLQGEVLLCRTYPKSDLHIVTLYDYDHIHFGKQQVRQGVISQLQALADRTVCLVLHWQDGQTDNAVEFEPGQCMELEIPGTGIRRAYSLANTSNWRGEMKFLIRLQPEGQFSTYLTQRAAVGQELTVYGPSGAFGLQANRFNPAVFIAGGTGLAPFLSMLRRMAEWGEDSDVHLIFGVNRESELFCIDELEQLRQRLPGLQITVCVWQPDAAWKDGFVGTPAEAFQQYLLTRPDHYDIYLCGPPLLVTAATQVAIAHGIAEQRIFSEKFG